MGADNHLTVDMSDSIDTDEIHGYVCDECLRTHCSEARECTCHEPGCYGTVTRLADLK